MKEIVVLCTEKKMQEKQNLGGKQKSSQQHRKAFWSWRGRIVGAQKWQKGEEIKFILNTIWEIPNSWEKLLEMRKMNENLMFPHYRHEWMTRSCAYSGRILNSSIEDSRKCESSRRREIFENFFLLYFCCMMLKLKSPLIEDSAMKVINLKSRRIQLKMKNSKSKLWTKKILCKKLSQKHDTNSRYFQ